MERDIEYRTCTNCGETVLPDVVDGNKTCPDCGQFIATNQRDQMSEYDIIDLR